MPETFRRPVHFVEGQDTFRNSEVGVTHPNTSAFVRLKDNGDVEIVAGEGCSIILHTAKKSITFVADSVKFLTRTGSGGLVWNKQAFNENADTFNEPALVPIRDEDGYSLYKGVDHFLYGDTGKEETAPPMSPDIPPELAVKLRSGESMTNFPNASVTDPETGAVITYEQYYAKFKRPPPFGTGVK
jgi:hypothetical protein